MASLLSDSSELRGRSIRTGCYQLYISCFRRGLDMISIGLGAAVYIAIKPVLKIYVILLIGYLAARYNILTTEITRGISNLVVNILIPSLTFNKIVQTLSYKDIKTMGVVILTALVLFTIGGICSLIILGITPVPKRWFWGLIFAGIFPNISDLPIAYVQSMQHSGIFSMDDLNKGVAYICIFLTFQGFVFMNLGAYRIVGLDFRDSDDEERTKEDLSLSGRGHPVAQHEVGSGESSRNSFGSISEATGNVNSEGRRLRLESAVLENTGSAADQHSTTWRTTSGPPTERIDPPLSHCANSTMYLALSLQHRGSSSARDSQAVSVKSLPCDTVKESLQYDNVCARPATVHGTFSKRAHQSRIQQRALGIGSGRDVSGYNPTDRGPQPLPQGIDLCAPNLASCESPTGGEQMERSIIPEQIELRDDVSSASSGSSASPMERSVLASVCEKTRRKWLFYIAMTCLRPASSGPLLGIICCLVPWLKALFVHNYLHFENAPDDQPVLNFVMDVTEYLGNACVPTGLLLLGSTFARLRFDALPKGVWRAVLMLTSFRLIALPIIGILFADELRRITWLDDDIGKFVVILTWTMPSTSAQVYFTSFFSPADSDHLQMSLLSLFFMTQYAVLFFAMAFVVTYTIKVQIK
ncbi:AaceriAGL149Cp [[Ashbya] aceris (nom. inval.)]|nr:AaceriAGL149Cp [[Ashbya] aceris (nom. inval.)]